MRREHTVLKIDVDKEDCRGRRISQGEGHSYESPLDTWS